MKKNKLIGFVSVVSIALSTLATSVMALERDSATSSQDNNNLVTIQVMNHLCNSNIKNIDDFKALENGKDPIGAFANTIINCPTTPLPKNNIASGTVSSPRTNYEFSVLGENSAIQYFEDADFMEYEITEADVNKDVDGNGIISTTTALDISHYQFSDVNAGNGKVDIMETIPPNGFHFGAVRFTPPQLIPNNDKQTFLASDDAKGLIKLDVTNDTDKTVMLHVYNFRNPNNMKMDNGNHNGNMGSTTNVGNMGSSTSTSSMGTSTNMGSGTSTASSSATRSMIISNISALQQQIQNLFIQIQQLFTQLQ